MPGTKTKMSDDAFQIAGPCTCLPGTVFLQLSGKPNLSCFQNQLKLCLISRFCADIEHSCEVACPQLCYTKSLYLHYIMYDMHKECIGTWELKGAYEIPT